MTLELRLPGRSAVWGAVVVLLTGLGTGRPAAGLTPSSPEVRRAIEKAVKYLESDVDAADPLARRPGGRAVVAMALVKCGASKDRPKIVQAVGEIRHELGERVPEKLDSGVWDIYSTGLSTIFLVTLDPDEYRPEIECLLGYLRLRQKSHGGWGYPNMSTGDTSMTQYGVLSSWEAVQAGFTVPAASVNGVAHWLLRTQDPSGCFGYQGRIADGDARVTQSETSNSMTAAGMGSLYICSDLLGLGSQMGTRDENVPAALREVKSKQPQRQAAIQSTIDPQRLRDAVALGNTWMATHYDIRPQGYTHYYLYALERYSSFRELAEGKSEKEPKWYTDGARFLIETQTPAGTWTSQCGTRVDTAFATLFLLRSAKKSIEKARSLGDGVLVGGRGLPKDTDDAAVRMGRVVSKSALAPAEELMAMLEQSDDIDYEKTIAALSELPPQETEALAAQHAMTFRRLAAGKAPELRMAAIRALGQTRSFDQVPTLIAALGDPEATVAWEAEEALRRISHKPSGSGVKSLETEEQRRAAAEQWKAWFRGIRPGAEFEE